VVAGGDAAGMLGLVRVDFAAREEGDADREACRLALLCTMVCGDKWCS